MFWYIVGLLLFIGLLGLCYLRRQIQGYWYDRSFRPRPKPDLSGKTALITGGNSGIGLEIAVGLARFGANVIIACRSLKRGEAAVAYIKKRTDTQSHISAMHLDLASLDSVCTCVEAFKVQNRPLHFLINNAGIAPPPKHTMTKDGCELTFQANYLGHFLLTKLLLPVMKESIKSEARDSLPSHRIIATSSGAHSHAEILWDDVNLEGEGLYGTRAYGQSKLAQILHSKELQRRFDKEQLPILAVAYTPGFARTNIFDSLTGKWWRKLLVFLIQPLILFLSRSSARGAQTALYCALSEQITGGGYYSNCLEKTVRGKDGMGNDAKAASRLWELSEHMLTSC